MPIQRYQNDALPLLATAAAIGWASTVSRPAPIRYMVWTSVGAVALAAIYVNLTAGMYEVVPPQPEYRSLINGLVRAFPL